ncbi:hypothetical protein FYK55_13135 [Roseiconus nitratireducens]|uniref:Uncharacterized protein n=1 Tax=Roseiconus nitratireducens TaxID=2605748 RepID=A0A5M6DDF2_9BACT|nr:hypothetical protein [Roseiconus nitratireducens]KAA5543215.1 hypothetical protein FYK55_13135 [Roseiconus nitratireducens]
MKLDFAAARCWVVLCMLGVLFVSGGATCSRRQEIMPLPPPPPVLNENLGLAEVAAAVNRTSVIRELSSNTATVDVLSMPSVPELSATLALRRDREFRLRASLPIVMGSGLDMGSNPEVFWFEVPEGIGKTLYFARHDEYQRQLDRAILPVDPTWIMDSLGLVQIDPAQVLQGPVRRPDGKLEIRSAMPTPAGVFQRVCYIDAQAGHVTDQILYSPNRVEVARSSARNHEFFPEQQCSLPHIVELQLSPVGGPPLHMKIEVGTYAINQILSGDPNLFVMPQGASQSVDLSRVSPAAIGAGTPATYQASARDAMPYRGFVR